MASNIIHYAISLKVLEQIEVDNKERFLSGASVGPDASFHDDGSYDVAHYFKLIADNTKKGIDWKGFVEEYKTSISRDDFCLGYYCHLIQDAIWYHDIVDKYIRCYTGDAKKTMYQKGYNDYARLNYLLIKEFNLSLFQNADLSVPIKEITEERLKTSLGNFEQWFEAEACKKDELELYKWDVIMSYIDKCVSICNNQINLIKNGNSGIDPIDYFVKT